MGSSDLCIPAEKQNLVESRQPNSLKMSPTCQIQKGSADKRSFPLANHSTQEGARNQFMSSAAIQLQHNNDVLMRKSGQEAAPSFGQASNANKFTIQGSSI